MPALAKLRNNQGDRLRKLSLSVRFLAVMTWWECLLEYDDKLSLQVASSFRLGVAANKQRINFHHFGHAGERRGRCSEGAPTELPRVADGELSSGMHDFETLCQHAARTRD